MFVPYADAGKICEELAAYKIGDVVVFLKDIEFRGGIIKKSTKGRIVSVSLRDGIKIPTVVETDVNDYYANSDAHVFSYKVVPLRSDGKEDERGCLDCCSDMFEKELINDDYDHYRIKKAVDRNVTTKYYAKSISIAAVVFAFVLCAFTLPMMPYLKSAFATCQSFEQSLFIYPFSAVVIGSPLAAFITIVATDKQYAPYRIGKILKRKQV